MKFRMFGFALLVIVTSCGGKPTPLAVDSGRPHSPTVPSTSLDQGAADASRRGTRQPLTGQAYVPAGDCGPCTLDVHTGVAQYEVLLESGPNPKHVALRLATSSTAAPTILPIVDGDAADFGSWQFSAPDINFDGYADLYLMTRQGVVNEYGEYWRFVPETSSFEDLGVFPVFAVDTKRKRLKTYERHGSAGLEHESREYAIASGKPVLDRRETQIAVGPLGTFEQTISTRAGAEMKVVDRKAIIVRIPAD
jgi:hypothetical protein